MRALRSSSSTTGSTDDTASVAARFPAVKCVHQPNGGLAAARNTGIRESRGEYLVFLDADDRLLPGALRTSLDCFRVRPECAFVSGHDRMMREDDAGNPDSNSTCRPNRTHIARSCNATTSACTQR